MSLGSTNPFFMLGVFSHEGQRGDIAVEVTSSLFTQEEGICSLRVCSKHVIDGEIVHKK